MESKKAFVAGGGLSVALLMWMLSIGLMVAFAPQPPAEAQVACSATADAGCQPAGGVLQTDSYTSSTGTFVWTKNGKASLIEVWMVSPGAGGGSGASVDALATAVGGGGGGGSSNTCVFYLSPSLFATTETITIPVGGAGGAAVTGVTNGNPGSAPASHTSMTAAGAVSTSVRWKSVV